MGRTKNQRNQVLEYMQKHIGITQRDAYRFGCTRLSARIFELREMGYTIIKTTKKITAVNGDRVSVAYYKLIEGGGKNG